LVEISALPPAQQDKRDGDLGVYLSELAGEAADVEVTVLELAGAEETLVWWRNKGLLGCKSGLALNRGRRDRSAFRSRDRGRRRQAERQKRSDAGYGRKEHHQLRTMMP
jgi:hypothetical protein